MEVAAKYGPEARRWPWGDDWDTGRCNTREADIHRTSVVGSFPGGANWTRDFPFQGQGEAVQDLAGNVWEWCSTRWQENYPLPLLPREWTLDYLEGDAWRTLRGGSWFYVHSWARGAYRYWAIPDFGNLDYVGFRCCVATPSLK